MVSVLHMHQSRNISNLFSFIVISEGKALLSIGPFAVVEDAELEPEPLPEAFEASDTDSMQSDGPAAVEGPVSGSATPGKEFASTSGDVVVVSHDPAATLALWLPGQLKDGLEAAEQVEGSRKPTNELVQVQKRESNPQKDEIRESPLKLWQAKFGFVGKKSAAEAGPPLSLEMDVPNMANLVALGQRQAGPVIRSKLQFSKGTDGSQTLSYEEEVVRKDDDGSSDCGTKNRGRRGLRAAFLDLIR